MPYHRWGMAERSLCKIGNFIISLEDKGKALIYLRIYSSIIIKGQ